ncbi:MAG: hypothetical protein ACREB5_11295 [Sphingomonadaceae bacterium]
MTVKDAWVRAPAPGQKVAGAYPELVSRTPLALTGAASRSIVTLEAEVRDAGSNTDHRH